MSPIVAAARALCFVSLSSFDHRLTGAALSFLIMKNNTENILGAKRGWKKKIIIDVAFHYGIYTVVLVGDSQL